MGDRQTDGQGDQNQYTLQNFVCEGMKSKIHCLFRKEMYVSHNEGVPYPFNINGSF